MAEKEGVGLSDEVSGDGFQIQTENETRISTFGFDVKTQKSDLVLIVENQRLHVKRSVLEDASPIFESMFEEELQGNRNELIIHGVKCSDFAEFLSCIQPRQKKKITMDNVFRMLELADQYIVEDLKGRCEDYLLFTLETCQNKNISVLELLGYACKFGLMELKKTCTAKTAKVPPHETTRDEAFKILPFETKCELYEQMLPDLILKSHLADFVLKIFSKEEEAVIGLFTDVKVTKISCKSTDFTDPIFKKFVLWDIDWILTVSFSHQSGYRRQISFSQDGNYNKNKLNCQIGIIYVIQNNIPWKDNSSKLKFFTHDSSNWLNSIPIDEKNLEDKASGFDHNGAFNMDVYLLMNKPSY